MKSRRRPSSTEIDCQLGRWGLTSQSQVVCRGGTGSGFEAEARRGLVLHDLSEKSDDQDRVDRCTFSIRVPILLSSRFRYRKPSRTLVIIPLRRENNAQKQPKTKRRPPVPMETIYNYLPGDAWLLLDEPEGRSWLVEGLICTVRSEQDLELSL